MQQNEIGQQRRPGEYGHLWMTRQLSRHILIPRVIFVLLCSTLLLLKPAHNLNASVKSIFKQLPALSIEMVESTKPLNSSGVDLYPISQTGGCGYSLAVSDTLVFVGGHQRLQVFEARTPNYMELLAESIMLSNNLPDISLSDQYAYAAAEDSGLLIFDLSNPHIPYQIGQYQSEWALSVAVRDNMAYIADKLLGLLVIDVSDPTLPSLYGSYSMGYQAATVLAVSENYAYVAGSGSTLRVVDISDPHDPQEIGFLVGNQPSAIAVQDNHAYVLDSGQLKVVNISAPDQPIQVGMWNAVSLLNNDADMVLDGNFAYVTGKRSIVVIDISNPTQPVLENELAFYANGPRRLALSKGVLYTSRQVGDEVVLPSTHSFISAINVTDPNLIHLVTSYSHNWPAQEVVVDATYAYIATKMGLTVVDFSSPRHPITVGNLERYDFWGRDVAIAKSQNYLLALRAYSDLAIVDVSNPKLPRLIKGYDLDLGSTIINITIANQRAYLAAGWSGLQILDITDPTQPTELGNFTQGLAAYDVAVQGDYAYIADFNAGLRIFDVSDPKFILEVGQCAIGPQGGATQVSVDGAYAYLFHLFSNQQFTIVDLTNPAFPVPVCNVFLDDQIRSITAADSSLYVSTDSGLKIFDVSSPSYPQLVSARSLPGGAYKSAVTDKVLFVAAGAEGLFSFAKTSVVTATVSGLDHPVLVAIHPVTYTFTAQTFPEPVAIFHHFPAIDLIPSSPPSFWTGMAFEWQAMSIADPGITLSPTGGYTIEVSYAGIPLTDVSVASLALFWWDGYMWQRESSSRIDVAQESLIATPTRAGLWAVFVSLPPESPRVYLPLVMKSWQTFDLAIIGMEVVQVTQTTDNRIPLITGKPIVLRVMVEVVPDKPFQDTYLQVEAFRKGVALAGSPLNIGPWTVFHSPFRDRFAHSFNLRLPDDWAQGEVTFRASVTSGSNVLEAQQNNNVREFVASFTTMPPIDLKIVPITYVHTPTGQTVPAPTQYQVTDRILSIFPVDGVVLSEHVPLTYQGNLCESVDWSNFLKAVTDLREAEGVPMGQVYYGLVSSKDIYDVVGCSPAYSGIGWIGLRASAGSEAALPHELGHNFGLFHTGCAPGYNDPAYPYPNGSIGQPGVDPKQLKLYVPIETADFMSYCSFTHLWVSDYTYQKLYNDQSKYQTVSASRSTGNFLLVRIAFTKDGNPILLPVYRLSGFASVDEMPISELSVVLYDQAAYELARYPVHTYASSEPNTETQAAYVRVPLIQQATEATILHTGRTIAVCSLNTSTTDQVEVVSVERRDNRIVLSWDTRGQPVLVRYTIDDGATWIMLALDVRDELITVESSSIPQNAVFQVVTSEACISVENLDKLQ